MFLLTAGEYTANVVGDPAQNETTGQNGLNGHNTGTQTQPDRPRNP